MAKISVIIPVYNVENYLESCLESVINQSLENLEILCIDDCSADGSLRILQDYASKDSRIKVFCNTVNLKAAGSRNVGLDNASADYIYFLDADDYLDENYLREMYERAVQTNADIVMNTNIKTHTDSNVSDYIHPSMPGIPAGGCLIDAATAIDKSFCVVWNKLFKRDFLENKNIRFKRVNMTEDNVFHYMASISASSIFVFKSTSAYHYILRDDSVTGIVKTNNQRDLQTMKAYDLIFDYLSEEKLLSNNKAKLFNVSGFFKVDTEEKYDFYKSYFNKIKDVFESDLSGYNDMDIFFARSILSSASFQDYKATYPLSVAIAFLKRGR